MSLRRKAARIGLIQLVGVAAVVWLVGTFLMGLNVAKAERGDGSAAVAHVRAALDADLDSMERTARDWGVWDQTADFVTGRYPRYVEENLEPDAAEGVGLDAMLFLDAENRLVHAQLGDSGKARADDLVARLMDLVRADPGLVGHPDAGSGKSGIVSTEHLHALVASQRIVRNSGSGPAVGTLIIARNLDGPAVARLRKSSGVRFHMYCVTDDDLPDSVRQALPALSRSLATDPKGRPAVDTLALGHADYAVAGLAPDISGHGGCVIRVVLPRTDYLNARTTVTQMALALLVLGLVGGGAAALWWDRFLYGRLDRLTASVKRVAETGDLSGRVDDPGPEQDELALLAHTMNRALGALQATERDLAESAARFAAVMRDASDCVLLADAETGRLLEANPAFRRATRRSMSGREDLSLEDVLGKAANEIGEAMADEEGRPGRFLAERQVPVPGGGVVDLELLANLVRIGERDVILVVGRDISERRRLDRLKNDFTATISHELRTPLTTIIGWATLLARDPETHDPTMLARGIRQIQRKGDEMRRLVEDLLSVNRIQTGRLELELEAEVAVADLVEDCARRAELTPDHTIAVYLENGLPPLMCDRDRLRYVLATLVDNAAKFSPEGGPIRLRARREGPSLVVSVEDRGVGIPPEDVPTVFDKFVQADMSSTRRFGGSGLGLYIAKSIVEAHGGDIALDSVVGEGTTFTVRIPFDGPPASASSNEEAEGPNVETNRVTTTVPGAAQGVDSPRVQPVAGTGVGTDERLAS